MDHPLSQNSSSLSKTNEEQGYIYLWFWDISLPAKWSCTSSPSAPGKTDSASISSSEADKDTRSSNPRRKEICHSYGTTTAKLYKGKEKNTHIHIYAANIITKTLHSCKVKRTGKILRLISGKKETLHHIGCHGGKKE